MYTYLGIQKCEDILESGAKDVCKFRLCPRVHSTFWDLTKTCGVHFFKDKVDNNKEKKL